MLYIVNAIVFWIWATWLIRKGRFSWHTIVGIYVLIETGADIGEVIFNQLAVLYEFTTHLFANPDQSDRIGIMLADVIILPASAMIFCYYAIRNNPWVCTILFALLHVSLEWLYLKLGYIRYHNWSIFYSALAYLVGFRVLAFISHRLVNYDPPMPYRILLLSFTYTVLVIPGAIFSGVLLNLHQWRPHVFNKVTSDDRFADIGFCLLLALVTSIVIPKISRKYKIMTFIILSAFASAFALYSHDRGWLIYHNWNDVLTVARYVSPFFLVIWYDHWETGYVKNRYKRKELVP